MSWLKSFSAGAVLFLMPVCAIAETAGNEIASDVNPEWVEFQKNPASYMQSVTIKSTPDGSAVNSGLFSPSEISRGTFANHKMTARLARWPALSRRRHSFAGEVDSRARVSSFFDSAEFAAVGKRAIFNLYELDRAGLRTSSIEVLPWSGSYWPIYQGGAGARYASSVFMRRAKSWRSAYAAVQDEQSLAAIVARNDSKELEELSPSEKYDLLIGDPSSRSGEAYGFLTPLMWQEGIAYANRRGHVEEWMGLCHGWAPASLIDPRPTRIVEATPEVNREAVRFYPSDIKGLSTLLWAKGDYVQRFIGGRCGSKTPNTDPESGRVLDPDCFDVNPAVWHLVVTNHIGQLKRGFVIDATYDYEVWNQPVFSYEYRYFNPQTGQSTDDLAQATIAVSDYSNDKFKKYRSPSARTVVGVEMSIGYTAETAANHAESDSPQNDRTTSVTYLYDLELNDSGEVIGGEWYRNGHPDFLWVPDINSRPVSPGDGVITSGAWRPDQPLPQFWKHVAVRTAQSTGEPLANIVSVLVESAR